MFKVFFFNAFYRISALKPLYFYFCNFIKKWENKLKGFFQRILQEITKKKKKKILGTSDAWSTIRLSHRPSNPAYCIENWRICSNYVQQCRPYQCSFSRISQFRSLNRNWERAELDEEIRRIAQSVRILEYVLYHIIKFIWFQARTTYTQRRHE